MDPGHLLNQNHNRSFEIDLSLEQMKVVDISRVSACTNKNLGSYGILKYYNK